MRFENRPLSDIRVGDSASLSRLVTLDDLYVFATTSGNYNPMHLTQEDADHDGRPDAVAPGMFVAALVSAVIGMKLPGPGTLYRSQVVNFHERAHAGDELVTTVTVQSVAPDGQITVATEVRRAADGALILDGEACVIAPTQKHVWDGIEVPGLIVQRHRHFEALIARARPLPPLVTAVVAPEEEKSLQGALIAADESIITPILIGDPDRIAAAAAALGVDLDGVAIEPCADHAAAARRACELVREGRAGAVMKGHLHTDALLRPMIDRATGLRVGRRFTHVFVMDVPGQDHPILVTDAAINIAPDLATKVDIVQNAIDLALSIGIEVPRVGVLSAVETVNPAIASSVDGALLSKMAERGQITGGLVDGPLAMDNAVDIGAARTKGLTSEVAGRANILVVPGLDAGNMLAKQLAYISHAEGAGLVLGARVPVILNSRADSPMARLASCAVAALRHAAMTQTPAEPAAPGATP
ncbi:MAG: bifunctional enoyl-CoA hydratase/phosphate acetyltransferase [Roseovarius sp.]|nr:bifunctional enoyl-CoA hydratase/phosphate acetyltransferase [Roseovarius sp.]